LEIISKKEYRRMEKLDQGKYVFTYHQSSTRQGLNLEDMKICNIIPKVISIEVDGESNIQIGTDFPEGKPLERMRWDYNNIAKFFEKSVKNLYNFDAQSNSTSGIFMVFDDMTAVLIEKLETSSNYTKCLVGTLTSSSEKQEENKEESSYFSNSYCAIC
jgi:hypothetical protein